MDTTHVLYRQYWKACCSSCRPAHVHARPQQYLHILYRWHVHCIPQVAKGAPLVVLEAMKMEHAVVGVLVLLCCFFVKQYSCKVLLAVHVQLKCMRRPQQQPAFLACTLHATTCGRTACISTGRWLVLSVTRTVLSGPNITTHFYCPPVQFTAAHSYPCCRCVRVGRWHPGRGLCASWRWLQARRYPTARCSWWWWRRRLQRQQQQGGTARGRGPHESLQVDAVCSTGQLLTAQRRGGMVGVRGRMAHQACAEQLLLHEAA